MVGTGGVANGGTLPVHFNSADITGLGGVVDGVVNLSDVSGFAQIYFGTYDFSGDFFFDGLMNLSDVGRLAAGNGSVCP